MVNEIIQYSANCNVCDKEYGFHGKAGVVTLFHSSLSLENCLNSDGWILYATDCYCNRCKGVNEVKPTEKP